MNSANFKPLAGKRILIVSSFFESNMPSLREHQYVKVLSQAGADVTLWTTTGSNVWRFNLAKLKPTNPGVRDQQCIVEYNFKLVRHKPIFRYSDLFWVGFSKENLRGFDIVHVIEFRQGWTAYVARAAKSLGLLVIYDHEQRADRLWSPLHRLDSLIRRRLIRMGSQYVDFVRHTVVANKKHFIANSQQRVPMELWPLGADEELFYSDPQLRSSVRSRLGFTDDDKVLIFSGKITSLKRPAEVVEAAVLGGWKLLVVGRIEDGLDAEMKRRGEFSHIAWASPAQLNELYNAADAAVFTNFSVSYWEAALAGAAVVVPRTEFSEEYIGNDPNFVLFGERSQFVVEEEIYRSDVNITESISRALGSIEVRSRTRNSDGKRFGWKARGEDLVSFYKRRLT